jgi:hypothetical protein
MYCRRCQYVLDGLPENRCPECGTGFDPDNAATFWPTPRRPRRLPVRWENIASALCFALCVMTMPRGVNREWQSAFAHILPIALLAFAFGFALSGAYRGERSSRFISMILLLVTGLFLLALAEVLFWTLF